MTAAAPKPAPALVVSHVADFSQRYPGETVTFYTRVELRQALTGFRLTVGLPAGLRPGAATGPGQPPQMAQADGAHYLVWELGEAGQPGQRFEFQCAAAVAPTQDDLRLESYALAAPLAAGAASSVETATVAVAARGRYLKYLPALYADDELMGRFLMLFESFWKPITQQIDQMTHYFDPGLAPADLLPWLATWIDLVLDERWPEAKRRQLLHRAMDLYRRRGTRSGLHDYLEIYTGVRPQIVEHGAHNFRLGREARLGPAIALGTTNEPHTFTVRLALPSLPEASEGVRAEQERRRIIAAIIEAEKPAHTAYTLEIESGPASAGLLSEVTV